MDADGLPPLDEAAFLAHMRRILQDIDAQHAGDPCRMCHGDGVCWMCRGNGRLLVPDYGLRQCRVCIGDGACIDCGGDGERRHG